MSSSFTGPLPVVGLDNDAWGTINNARLTDLDVGKVGKGERAINVADYASPAAAMAAASAGMQVHFPPATYALGLTSLSRAVNNLWIDAPGATFTVSGWGVPAFDLLDVHGWTLDIGTVQYVGTRGTHTGTLVRGQSPYALGCGVYTNGDRHHIRRLRTIGMPTPVNLSSWNGTTATGRYGQSNRIGRLECEGFDFGVLWIGQKDLLIEDIYAHDAIDDSGGVNPTHAYYCTATSGFRSTGVQIKKARCVDNPSGHAFQLKNCDLTQLGPHTAGNCDGLINVVDCNDLSWSSMVGTGILTGVVRAVTLQTVTTNCQRPVLTDTIVSMATDQDQGPVSVMADDAQINGMVVTSNRPTTTNTGDHDILLRGARGRVRGLTARSAGAGHSKGVAVGYGVTVATDWKIEDVTVNGQRSVADVLAGSTGTGIRYDPAAQTITGGGAAVTGSTADYYIVGGAPLMGQINSTANLTLTATPTDITGATVTFTAAAAGKLRVNATFDFSLAVAAEIVGGYLNVDGTNQAQQPLLSGSLQRAAVSKSWVVSLAAGSHTVKLQAARVTGSNTGHSVNSIHTGFTYTFHPGA